MVRSPVTPLHTQGANIVYLSDSPVNNHAAETLDLKPKSDAHQMIPPIFSAHHSFHSTTFLPFLASSAQKTMA